eukprot:TRINITY_DN17688_c0_g1_i1.p1 TRINITY_DN17688_c0_g1~~TRINITY_DN17688_c0_g1_i1.p1  ORF type:complete len:285 (-),score=25.41 TRINITY_DN17688_c0_g1_i1:55-909(-)
MFFNTGENLALTIVSTMINTTSIIGILSLNITFMLTDRLKNYKYRIISYITFCNLITSVSILLGRIFYMKNMEMACHFTAYTVQYGLMSSLLWTSILSYYVLNIIINPKWTITNQVEIVFNILIWTVSLIPLVLMKTQSLVGNAVFYCWIRDDKKVYRFFYLYIPFFLLLLLNLGCAIALFTKNKKDYKELGESVQQYGDYENYGKSASMLNLITTILIVQTICWIFPLTDRILAEFKIIDFYSTFLQVLFESLEGTLSAIIFFVQLKKLKVLRERAQNVVSFL